MMRKPLLLAVACLLSGCWDTTSPRDGILVTGTTSVNSIRASQSVSINLTIHNRGDEAVQLSLDECVPPFEVLNQGGQVVGPGSRVCALSLLAPVVVPAGGSTPYTTTWMGDSTGFTASGGFVYLSPGNYSIRPRVLVAAEGGGYVYGNPISITITP
jgi:hypothetical protein